jgi:protocatechuate 3,4-dioxygenase beta subunit
MKRRKFVGLGSTALTALLLPKLGRGQACTNLTQTDKYGLGPFYTAKAPQRIKLAPDYEPGQRVSITGTVSNCVGPMVGVNLDLWHATDSGCYKHPSDNCPDLPGHPDEFRLRGQVTTDAQGKYAFETIMPGAYLNGSKYRPQHIHCIISHASIAKTPIITQLYFAGDPYIIGDFAADDPSATNRIIPLVKHAGDPWQGIWNIQIPGNALGLELLSDPALKNFDMLMENQTGKILFHLPPNRSNQPVEFRLYNISGILLKRSLQTLTPVTLETTSLTAGSYLVELRWWTKYGLRTEAVPIKI